MAPLWHSGLWENERINCAFDLFEMGLLEDARKEELVHVRWRYVCRT